MNAPEMTAQTTTVETGVPTPTSLLVKISRVILAIFKGLAEVSFLIGLAALVLNFHLFPVWLGLMLLCAAVQFVPGSAPYPIANSTGLSNGVTNSSTSAAAPGQLGEDAFVLVILAFAFLLAPFLTVLLPTFIVGLFASTRKKA